MAGGFQAGAPGRGPDRDRLVREFADFLIGLPAETRAALWLHVDSGDELQAISECLGLEPGVVEALLEEGVSAVKAFLGSRGVSLYGPERLRALFRELPVPEPPPRFWMRLEALAARVKEKDVGAERAASGD